MIFKLYLIFTVLWRRCSLEFCPSLRVRTCTGEFAMQLGLASSVEERFHPEAQRATAGRLHAARGREGRAGGAKRSREEPPPQPHQYRRACAGAAAAHRAPGGPRGPEAESPEQALGAAPRRRFARARAHGRSRGEDYSASIDFNLPVELSANSRREGQALV